MYHIYICQNNGVILVQENQKRMEANIITYTGYLLLDDENIKDYYLLFTFLYIFPKIFLLDHFSCRERTGGKQGWSQKNHLDC